MCTLYSALIDSSKIAEANDARPKDNLRMHCMDAEMQALDCNPTFVTHQTDMSIYACKVARQVQRSILGYSYKDLFSHLTLLLVCRQIVLSCTSNLLLV